MRTVMTLDQHKMELHKLGFQVSRSGIYLKLLIGSLALTHIIEDLSDMFESNFELFESDSSDY